VQDKGLTKALSYSQIGTYLGIDPVKIIQSQLTGAT